MARGIRACSLATAILSYRTVLNPATLLARTGEMYLVSCCNVLAKYILFRERSRHNPALILFFASK